MVEFVNNRMDAGSLRRLEIEIQGEAPDLIIRQTDESIIAEGPYTLFEGGKALDRFIIRIEVSIGDPPSYPVLFETAGRIPRIEDRHINPNGSCCVMVMDEMVYRYPNGCPLVDFLKGPVPGFLISQVYFEIHGEWPFGQRSHGLRGRAQFYAEQVGSDDWRVGARVIEMVAGTSTHSKALCPCGSRRRLKACHPDTIRKLRDRLPGRIVRDALRAIEIELRESKQRVPTKKRLRWPNT